MAAIRSALRCSGVLRSCASQGLRRNIANQGSAGAMSCLQTANISSARTLVAVVNKSALATNSFRSTFSTSAICHVQTSIATSSLVLGENTVNQGHSGVQEQELEDDDEQNHRRKEVEPFYDKDVIDKVQLEMEKSLISGQIFAVVHISGRQFKVTINDVIIIDRIDAQTGDRLCLEKVLLVGGKDYTLVGRPLLEHGIVRVEATVIEKTKSDPVHVFKKKRRKNYIRWKQHQQDITILRINSIDVKPPVLGEL